MGNIWRICFQFPWQSNVRNGIINVEIYHYRGQGENGCFARERGQLVACLCLKAPREFPRVKPLLWVEKTTKYRRFRTFWATKNWKKFQSGVRHKCGSYSSVKQESRQIALCEAENTPPPQWCKMPRAWAWARAKRGHFEVFTPPKKSTFMDATVVREIAPWGDIPRLRWLSHSGFGVPCEIVMITSSAISSRSWR